MTLALAFLLSSQMVTGPGTAHAIRANSAAAPISIQINVRTPTIEQGSPVRHTPRHTVTELHRQICRVPGALASAHAN
jgi:hypothetical protein